MNLSLEYIAGLFDGEGWITVSKNKKTFIPIVGIKMNGFNLLKKLHNEFGGYFYQRKNYINRPLTEWTLKGAYIGDAAFGDFDWSTEDALNITLTLKYDYAILQF